MHEPEELAVSVVLVSFNTEKLTLAAIKSLYESVHNSPLRLQVILVDNGSQDATVQSVAELYPEVQVIEVGENIGFGPANNRAFPSAESEYILLLNTDTVVKQGAVQTMVDAMNSSLDIAAVGCRLENADGSLQRSCWSFPNPTRAWLEALGLHRSGLFKDCHRWDHSRTETVDFVIGAALLLRRTALREVGGFDESFFLYAEEADLQKRLHTAGWRVVFCPFGTIVHLGGASGAPLGDRQFVEFNRATARYIRKHHGWIGLLVFRLALIAGTIPRLCIGYLFGSRSPSLLKMSQTNLMKLRWWMGLDRRPGICELGQSNKSSI